MGKKVTIPGSNKLSNLSDDWGGVNSGNNPITVHGVSVPAKAEWGMNRGEVERFIKSQFKGKAGEFYYDSDTTKYLVFADVADRDLYLSDREEYVDLLLGSFDAPANYTAEITMLTPSSNVVLAGTTGNYIDFTFDIKNRSGSSTGEAVIATFTFNNSGNVRKVTQVYAAGTSVHFLADQYLSTGTNSVSVVVTGRNTLASSMAAVSYTMVALELTSNFDFSQPVEVGQYLSIPYTLEGAGVKYLEWYVDGVLQQDTDTVTDLRVSRIKNIDTTGWNTGKHNVQTRAYITNDGTNYYSVTLYFDVVIAPVGEVWSSNTTFVLLGLILSSPTNSTPSVSGKQYETIAYQVAMYDSRSRSLDMTISDNGTQVQSVAMQPDEVESLTYTPATTGNHTLTFAVGGDTASFVVVATASDITIEEETDGLLLKLSAKGRSNSESTPGTWTYGQIATTFNGFSWNEQSGWNNGALVIPAGASIDVALAPLTGDPKSNGRTIEIDFETTDVDNEDASVISLLNSTTGAGLEVTASTAKLLSSGGANINTKFRDGDRVHLTFIINRTTGDNGRLMFIVNNGILERAASFAATDVFRVDDNLHIGSTGCKVKVYSIRVYDKALTIDQSFCNYAVDSDNLLEIAINNDILNESTGLIDADKVNAKIPIMIITGDMQPIFDATDKNTTVYVDLEYRNLQDATKNFTATHVRMRPQGTSSLGYPRKNLRPYTSSQYGCVMRDANGDVIEDGLYAFKDGAQPVNCWTLKADYAESSGSHNTGVARMWNDLMYSAQLNGQFVLRTAAQNAALTNGYNYDVRTTIDGFPIVVFHRQNAESELVCLGQYNFNNDKSTEKVFGFTDIPGFDNTNVQCFEFLANESPICLFDDISSFDTDWDDAFESRYPDTKTPNLTPLKTLATWINSCKNNQQKWVDEKAAHFDLPKLAAYYVYLMRFGAVDQPVKNAMIMTEDGVHWFFINYDNDTILGIDNISTVLNAWDYDRSTQKTGGAYYFAGHNSVLWNCFEADSECMALVREIDTALYSAGLTYANMIRMFDDEQCDKWCERLYNDNGNYKYIQPFKDKGSAVLYMLQGSRKSYRHWWLQHRMDKYDALWATGAFKSRIVRFIAEGAPGGTFVITSAANTNFGYGINSVEQEIGVSVAKNATHNFTISRTLAIGDPVAIYNANNISKIDLSDFVQYLTTLYINQAVGNNGSSELKSLILGDGETQNIVFTEIGGLSAIPTLEELDIRGFSAITNMGLGTLNNLHIFKADNSGLTSFAPAAGVTLTNVSLPSSLQSLSLNAANVAALTYTPTTTLRSVSLQNVTGVWDTKSFVNTWLALLSDAQLAQASLTLTGINWTGMTATQVVKMGSVGTKNLQGKVTLSSMTYEEWQQIVAVFGASVFNAEGSFVIDAPAGFLIQGPSQVLAGNTGTFTAASFPASSANILYLLYDGGYNLITAQTDGQGRVYRSYDGIVLYEASGIISVPNNLASDTVINVRARAEGTDNYSSYLAMTAKAISYPSTVNISGNASISQNGTYNFTKSFNTDDFTAEVLSVAWSLEQNNACSLLSSDSSGATIQVTNTPATALTVTLTCTVTFTNNVTRTDTKNITLQLTFPSSISINGVSSINANGNFNYTKTINGSYTASLLSVAWSLTSNNNVVISSQNDNGATVSIANGNDTAVTLTLTCACTFTGGVTKTGTKSISVAVIAAPIHVSVPTPIDLGLPSGRLWASWNIGADSEEEYGAYFTWGNIEPHYPTSESSFSPYSWGNSNAGSPYKNTPGATIPFTSQTKNADYSEDSGYDAARELLGGSWRMPTATEFKELKDNTDNEWTTINGIYGRKFMKKSDHSVYVFFPAADYGYSTSLELRGTHGYYCSSSLYSADDGYNLYLYSSSVQPQYNNLRFCGVSVRAVQ